MEPHFQGSFGIGVLFMKIAECFSGDDSH
jgi:hypothetical protein